MPALEVGERVHAEEEEERGSRAFGTELGERVDGVARGVAARLARVHGQPRHARDGSPEHLDPFGRARAGRPAVSGAMGGQEAERLERVALGELERGSEVAEVHRIEGAAEQTDALAARTRVGRVIGGAHRGRGGRTGTPADGFTHRRRASCSRR